MRGLLIAICGLDGSGKTTQIQLLHDWFQKNNIACAVTRQPTDNYRNDHRVRAYLDDGHCPDMKVLALLSAADRRYHMATFVEPTLQSGVSVISDRYLFSALAYFTHRGLSPDYVRSLNGEIRMPDLTVFLDLEPEITLQRVATRDRGITKYEEKGANNFIEVRKAFQEVLPHDALVLDATSSPQDIQDIIQKNVRYKLKQTELENGEITSFN